jgi:spore coat protein CotH
MMNYMGVASPLYSYANISVNGKTFGLYLALEGVEESFAKRNYGNNYGQLYKPESTEIGGNAIGKADCKAMADALGNAYGDVLNNSNSTKSQDKTNNDSASGATTKLPSDTEPAKSSEVSDQTENNARDFGNIVNAFSGLSGGTDLQYVDDNINSYSAIFNSALFDSDNSDYERVIEALKNISNGTELEEYINVDATLRYCAVNTVLVNFDSYFGSLKHNYYLYEDNGQLTMLPWDFNLAFAGFQNNDASSAVNYPIDTPVSGTTLSERPIIGKLLEVQEYKDLYHSYLQEIISGYFKSGLFEKTVQSVDGLISDYVKNDPSAFYTFDEYNTGVETLTSFGLLRAESIDGQLKGTIPSTDTEQTENPDSLIDASGINISAMGTQGGGNMGGNRMDAKEAFNGNGTMQQPDRNNVDGNMLQPPDRNNTDGTMQQPPSNTDGTTSQFPNKTTKGNMNGINNSTQNVDADKTTSGTNLIITLISAIFMIIGLIFMIRYHRKKYRL